MTAAFHLDVTHTHGTRAVIALTGEFDVATAPLVRARALELIASDHPDLITDLTGVTFCDSSGLGALVGIWRCAKDAGGSLILAAVPDRLGRLLHTTGMDSLLPTYPSVGAALSTHHNDRTTA
ncbi:STAS domain-containing protein [Streptomyces sp. B1I3]|uniref:STAS domain-containing protein n=1 Tax=Streptomyces sp. B1I3 TaxID=3042264 RepID=UPI002788330A|nr:STAS domain-containing protein [Streptomyces sp. B1I3]MDQ0798143.1 anti-sigma B factor antagonist [Streptomyces sp. B1I3]